MVAVSATVPETAVQARHPVPVERNFLTIEGGNMAKDYDAFTRRARCSVNFCYRGGSDGNKRRDGNGTR
jgi:hypothetical protein